MRKHFLFSGWVQGVGFRYKAYHLANRYRVAGYVKNLDDGRVEMEAEGREEDIDMVIQGLENDMYIRIEKTDAKVIPEKGESSFRTRY